MSHSLHSKNLPKLDEASMVKLSKAGMVLVYTLLAVWLLLPENLLTTNGAQAPSPAPAPAPAPALCENNSNSWSFTSNMLCANDSYVWKSFNYMLLGAYFSYLWNFNSNIVGARNSYLSKTFHSKALDWQTPGFHFKPLKNWMNGPFYYEGWYHLFYQYHPDAPVWGITVWGHAVSKELVNWNYLPIALEADQWYDAKGVWSGSVTIVDGIPKILYTGYTNGLVQVQNLAYPDDPSDPLLIKWVKYPGNPVIVSPPPCIDKNDFRDPSTAWKTPEGNWRILIGSKSKGDGVLLVYETQDFKEYKLLDKWLHVVPGSGMLECVDFYPISTQDNNGLDMFVDGPGVKYVVKVSLDDYRYDCYSIGTYDAHKGEWMPDNPTDEIGSWLKHDHGVLYASTTFYDPKTRRIILWSWNKETDTKNYQIKMPGPSVMGVPRTIVDDKETLRLKHWPVAEINKLRTNVAVFENLLVEVGSLIPLYLPYTSDQLDIVAEFELDMESVLRFHSADIDVAFSCAKNGGAAQRGVLGPFGFTVLAHKDLHEHTPVYFYLVKSADENLKTYFCTDLSRSSTATDVDRSIYGDIVPVFKGAKLSMRILVDHSIIEGFAQEGRTCITSRVYPTKAIYNNANLFVFNNATGAKVTVTVKVWQMKSAKFSSV